MTTRTGYQLRECLYEGTRTEVYRSKRKSDRASVILKILRDSHPNFTQLVQFRNQYAIARHLEHPNILTPLALERYGNGYALIMPDDGAIALQDYWQQKTPNTEEFLEIAIQLADALHYLAQEQIIHKDIKPANILICPETKQVKLIDFSISSLLPKETQTIQTANVLEGTLAYLSPEQTGRMNRGIDYRSDFYALGVTFYELLTGTVPFASDDPLELVHAHIAQSPKPIVSDRIPEVLSDIVLKLMAKNAEDRYQSALGLKYDLEKCLSQYKETKEIEVFPLGEQDRCSRFLIPEKLYGREKEVQALLDAFERVAKPNPPESPLTKGGQQVATSPSPPSPTPHTPHPTPHTPHPSSVEMMLVAGFSGIGKTAVVSEVHKPIVRQRGYFIKGKFDQFNRNIPFSAFVQAFRDLMGQLLGESDDQLQQWKGQILEAVGENGQVLIEVIPELERIIGQQPPVPELSGTGAQNRFNLLFEKFIAVFTTKEHPLTLFLDDLQWADSASLNLIKVLMGDSQRGYLLLLGAYRDNEVFPAHPLMLCLGELEKKQTTISTITLSPLSVGHINQLVADTLSCSLELAANLTDLVYEKTKGNPFFTTQFLKGLYQDGLITFERNLGYWQCDLIKVREAALTDDVVEFMVGRLHKLPEETQNVLQLAACIGNQFDLETLAIICENPSEEVAADLWSALREGLVLPQSQAYKFFQGWKQEDEKTEVVTVNYRFLHDRVQQAAYSLIPEQKKQQTHYQIGQLILQKISPEVREEKIFEIIGQLNVSIPLISEQMERDELAELNLTACRKAKNATACQAGLNYAKTGLSLLGQQGWQRQYEMSLALSELAAELASMCGDIEAMDRFIELVLSEAHSLVEQATVYRIKISSDISLNNLDEAIAIAQKFLAKLGVIFPENPTTEDFQEIIVEIETSIGDREIEELVNLPRMTEGEKIAAAEILTTITPATYMSGSALFPLVIASSVKIPIQYGNIPSSAVAYSCYGIIACNQLKLVETGVKFGRLALQLVSHFDAKTLKPDVFNIVGTFILHRQSHIQATLPLLKEGYAIAIDVGNLDYAGYTAHAFFLNSFWSSQPLEDLEREVRAYYKFLIQVNRVVIVNLFRVYWQSTLNLLGLTENPASLSGELFQEAEFLDHLKEVSHFSCLCIFHVHKLMLCYLFGELADTRHHATKARSYFSSGAGFVIEPVFYFYDSLTALATLPVQEGQLSEVFEQVEKNQTELNQYWVRYAPMNYQHKFDLVEAEKLRVLGNKIEAIELYDRAIAGAKENQYIQEEALANELFAKFYLNWGREKEAAVYMQEAYYCYARWGAKAKIKHLEKHYPQLLTPILQRQQLGLTANSQITTLTKGTVSQTNTSTGELLDLASLMKASRSLSQEIDLERAIAKFIEVIQENAGAQTVALMLFQADTLMLTAHATKEEMSVIHIPVETSNNVPKTLINQVKNTREYLVLDDAKEDNDYGRDDYINKYQPQSVLCIPLIDRGQLIGILYLENNQTSGAFTSDRIEILNLLCSQAAISLENAQLYNNLELKVQERTAELSQALQNLKDTQKQLVESEKMASLGSLVAGVAHEINTPIGTSITVASTLNEETQVFAEAIAKGQLKRSILNNYIETSQECTQLILNNLQRAGELIGSFKQVAVDRSNLDKRTIAIKEYLGEVLTSLMPNIRQQGHVVTVTGDENLQLTTYPGALAQIVTNLTNNSLIHAYPDGKSGTLHWKIELKEERLMIEYEDDGCGLAKAELEKIFEPFYTTARNKGGTGLGLHIVYNLVTQKLLGRIWAESQVGQGVKFTISIPK